MKREDLFARVCDITGKGMNEGYCINDGMMYIKEKSDMINHLRGIEGEDTDGLSDDELIEYFYEEEYFYHTDWYDDLDEEEDELYDENGNIVEL
jgi:hypothetical protein